MEEMRQLCEAAAGEAVEDVNEHGLPPGFRFHPTDEELITFYLASKVFHGSFCGVQIAEIDLNRCEPWDLPDVARMGEKEWYFFSLRDRKYPTGLRTNRATGAGYWKATGKDREVYSSSAGGGGGGGGGMTWNNSHNKMLLGMKKTLVFYKGRAPRGEKTKWVMHEYRLDGHFSYRSTSSNHHSSSSSAKEEWVICRIFHKTVEKKNGGMLFQLQGLQELAALHDYPQNSPPPVGCLPPLLEAAAACSSSPWELLCHHRPNNPPGFLTTTHPLLLTHNVNEDVTADQDDNDLKTILSQAVNVKNNNCHVMSTPTDVLKHCKKEDANIDQQVPGLGWQNYPNPLMPYINIDGQESGGFHMMLDHAPTSTTTSQSCFGLGGDTWSSLMGHAWPAHPLN